MNPLTNVKNINKLNDIEAELGVAGSKSSWHEQYKDSAYIFIGGLPFDLTEGDIVCVFSQYGEIVNINLVRDKKTGKSRGYCFLAYEDQRSTTLAVDNFNGIKILGRVIRVDHVSNYRKPKEDENDDEITKMLREEGCAPKIASPPPSEDEDDNYQTPIKKAKIGHKTKSQVKKKKKKKHKKDGRPTAKLQADSSDSSSSQSERDTTLPRQIRVKQEVDRGYGTPRELNVKEPSDRDEKYHPDEMRHRAEDTGRHRRTDGGKDSHRQTDRGRFRDSSSEGREREGDRRNRVTDHVNRHPDRRRDREIDNYRERDRGGEKDTNQRQDNERRRDHQRDINYREKEALKNRHKDSNQDRLHKRESHRDRGRAGDEHKSEGRRRDYYDKRDR